MTLQASGTITMADINVELGDVSNTTLELNGSKARGLAGISSGAIRLSDFYGKSLWRYSTSSPHYVWETNDTGAAYANFAWNESWVSAGQYVDMGATSATIGGYIYVKGPWVETFTDSDGYHFYYYRISRRVA